MEEKRIFRALQARDVPFERADVRQLAFGLNGESQHLPFDVVLIRCLSHIRALCAAKMLETHGVRSVNNHQAIATCGDKVLTTMALAENDVPTPRTAVVFSRDVALATMEKMGYPAVIKPAVGSWGRLMAKVNDREAAEAVLEHKRALGQGSPFYVQDYVHKPGRDIRTLVVGNETVYAIYRHSPHWITNTARGGEPSVCTITPEIDRISQAAARAVGGEIVAVDLLEAPDGSLLVNEVNHTPEFHGAAQATDVDIAGKIVDYVLSTCRERVSK
jgi:[lysine-biosynthesis-protein LysW]--L-2-aminoadipate ligase